jgi:prepilin-type N-terminal cleavage/methylation domain-containing protein
MRKINQSKGFTLIELMVAISIIALLATVVLSSLGVSKSKARDSQRIAELQSVQKALELNYITTGSYPQTGPDGSENSLDKKTSSMSSILEPLVSGGSIPSIPFPPAGLSAVDSSFYYRTVDNGTSVSYQCGGKDLGDTNLPYILYFISELPQNLPALSYNLIPVFNGYCLTNS